MNRVVLTVLLVAVNTLLQGQNQSGPDLQTTLTAMNRFVDDNSILIENDKCKVTMKLLRRDLSFTRPDGVTNDSSQLTWKVWNQGNDFLLEFSLSEIDPTSITVIPVLTLHHFEELDRRSGGQPIQPPIDFDADSVTFEGRDMKKAIHAPVYKETESGKFVATSETRDRSSAGIVVSSHDRAARFKAAFVHAVDLCGGKPSDFPASPAH